MSQLGSCDAFMDEIRNSKLFQMDTDDPDELAALFDNTVCSLLDRYMLPLSLRILLVDHVFHG